MRRQRFRAHGEGIKGIYRVLEVCRRAEAVVVVPARSHLRSGVARALQHSPNGTSALESKDAGNAE